MVSITQRSRVFRPVQFGLTIGLSIATVALVLAAKADDSSQRSRVQNLQVENYSDPRSSLALFLQANLGYGSLQGQKSMAGVPGRLGVLGSWQLDSSRWVFDAGAGTARQEFTNSNSVYKTLGGAYGELAARKYLTWGFQAGPVLNVLFNQGDAYASRQSDLHQVGLQALKEIPISRSDYVLRFGGRYLEAINAQERNSMIFADFQIGWRPVTKSTTIAAVEAPAKPAPLTADTRQKLEVKPNPIMISASEMIKAQNFLYFDVTQTNPKEQDQKRLKALAKKIKGKEKELFEKLVLIGHTDQTGGSILNNLLSEKRALSVKTALNQSGIPNEMIETQGKGFFEPVVQTKNKKMMARNRRVEMMFVGVKDTAALEKILNSIK